MPFRILGRPFNENAFNFGKKLEFKLVKKTRKTRVPVQKIVDIEVETKSREDIRKMYLSDAKYVDERKELMNQLIKQYSDK